MHYQSDMYPYSYLTGSRLILACRDLQKCEAAKREIIDQSFNKSVVCKELDLASCKSIRNFAKTIKEGRF